MEQKAHTELLLELCDRVFGPIEWSPIEMRIGPFRTDKPNLHSSKAEFLSELETVETALENARSLITAIEGTPPSELPRKTSNNLEAAIRLQGQEMSRSVFVVSAEDLVCKNILEHNLPGLTVRLLEHLIQAYEARLAELLALSEALWTTTGRPPNYYARTMALR